MIYEGTIKYETTTSRGSTKVVRESYLIIDAETFCDAEYTLYMNNQDKTNIDVVSLKRSRIKEIANTNRENERMFIATLVDVFTDEDGHEKELTYDIAFFAMDIEKAHNFIMLYSQQGYCMELKGIVETKFIDVLKYESAKSLHRD